MPSGPSHWTAEDAAYFGRGDQDRCLQCGVQLQIGDEYWLSSPMREPPLVRHHECPTPSAEVAAVFTKGEWDEDPEPLESGEHALGTYHSYDPWEDEDLPIPPIPLGVDYIDVELLGVFFLGPKFPFDLQVLLPSRNRPFVGFLLPDAPEGARMLINGEVQTIWRKPDGEWP